MLQGGAITVLREGPLRDTYVTNTDNSSNCEKSKGRVMIFQDVFHVRQVKKSKGRVMIFQDVFHVRQVKKSKGRVMIFQDVFHVRQVKIQSSEIIEQIAIGIIRDLQMNDELVSRVIQRTLKGKLLSKRRKATSQVHEKSNMTLNNHTRITSNDEVTEMCKDAMSENRRWENHFLVTCDYNSIQTTQSERKVCTK